MDIITIFDRYSVNHIHTQTGISRTTLRAMRDNPDHRVQHKTVRALAAWLNEPPELLFASVRKRQRLASEEVSE